MEEKTFVSHNICNERRNTISDKLMDKINEIHSVVIRTEERLDNHMLTEEKNTNNIRWWIMIGLPLLGMLLGIIWNNLNAQIGDIQKDINKHQTEINNIEIQLQQHDLEDRQIYKKK